MNGGCLLSHSSLSLLTLPQEPFLGHSWAGRAQTQHQRQSKPRGPAAQCPGEGSTCQGPEIGQCLEGQDEPAASAWEGGGCYESWGPPEAGPHRPAHCLALSPGSPAL